MVPAGTARHGSQTCTHPNVACRAVKGMMPEECNLQEQLQSCKAAARVDFQHHKREAGVLGGALRQLRAQVLPEGAAAKQGTGAERCFKVGRGRAGGAGRSGGGQAGGAG